MSTPIKCTIDFNANDTWTAVRSLLARICPSEAKFDSKAVTSQPHLYIDFGKSQYIGPDASAILARLILRERNKGRKIDVNMPVGPPGLVSYISYVGLEHLCRKGVLRDFATSDESGFTVLPLSQLSIATFQDADPIVNLVRKHQKLSSDSEEFLRICINEVIQNVYDHAKSSIGAILTAKYFTSTRQVRVAIVDAGLGVNRTLIKRYPDSTPELALERVTKGNYSAMSRENNMGLGISNLCAIVVDEHDGDIFIVSDRAAAVRRSKARPWKVETLPFCFRGTGVFFTLPIWE